MIDHAAEDAACCGHHTPAKYGFQSYISLPIMLADGTMFGTLCAIDPRPARLNTPQTVEIFKLFGELIAIHLDAAARVAASEARLLSERETSELREQFIAVLGHDLRNPLASIAAGTRRLATATSKEATGEILGLMQKSAARMSALIDNVLDFARGRLGSGLHRIRNRARPWWNHRRDVLAGRDAVHDPDAASAGFGSAGWHGGKPRFALTDPLDSNRTK